MNNIPPPSAATKKKSAHPAAIPLDDIGPHREQQDEQGIPSRAWGITLEESSPTSPNRKEAHRFNKKAETSKRKRNRYSFDLGLDKPGEGLPALPSITESVSRETSRPPSRALFTQEPGAMSSGGFRRGSAENLNLRHGAQQDDPQSVAPPEGQTWVPIATGDSIGSGGMPYFPAAGEGNLSVPRATSFTDSRNLLPLSASTRSSAESSPPISRYASPAVGYSSNASYHDSLAGSGILGSESDGVRCHGTGRAAIGVTTDTTGSDFDTDEDEVHTSKPLSARTLWSQRTAPGHQTGTRTSNNQWPWRSRRRTDDMLRDDQPADSKQGHARMSNEYSPLKRDESDGSLAGRVDRDTPSNSLAHSSSSYSNPMAYCRRRNWIPRRSRFRPN
jgi:hypothetical protein